MTQLTVVMAQINPLVGDIVGNTRLVLERARQAQAEFRAELVLFPELTLTGYPPEDLLLRPSLQPRIDAALAELLAAEDLRELYLVLGYPKRIDGKLFNMAGVLHGGQILGEYAKQELPNYQVFDEKRYFTAGHQPALVQVKGIAVALSVCEDIWLPGPAAQAKAMGAKLILNLNASPFHINKQRERLAIVGKRCQEVALPVIYVNQLGGQDELVFDGGSFAVNGDGQVAVQAPNYVEGLYPVLCGLSEAGSVRICPGDMARPLETVPAVYETLVLGVRDYVTKNGFKGVVLGLSGGIDSALTLAIAADALGPQRVSAVMMPFRYTSDMSREDAALQAQIMGVQYSVLSIEPMFDAFMKTLEDEFTGLKRDTTEENIQARCRGVLLMAISNKKGYLVLTTGNKSEMSVGYSTLYGDMAGGLDVLKDVPKMLVYALSEYRNSVAPVIPQRVIDRPPSAELAPGQVDQDSLPPYPVLDEILRLYVEEDCSADAIVTKGFDRDTVYRVLRMVDINEYKRRQAPVGLRITQRGFGRDRRYPITSGWKPGL